MTRRHSPLSSLSLSLRLGSIAPRGTRQHGTGMIWQLNLTRARHAGAALMGNARPDSPPPSPSLYVCRIHGARMGLGGVAWRRRALAAEPCVGTTRKRSAPGAHGVTPRPSVPSSLPTFFVHLASEGVGQFGHISNFVSLKYRK